MSDKLESLKAEILKKVREYQNTREAESKGFDRKNPKVPVSGKVFDEEDVATLIDSSLDFWLTAGKFTDMFESELAKLFGLRYALMTNSGSSANLIALSALTSKFLGDSKLNDGDEVITAAASFPTTVNPIFQCGLAPVFLDVELDTYNIDTSKIEETITNKTKAIMIAHTLGNPFDVKKITKICQDYNLFLIEDCCDALGSKFNGKMVGTFGDVSTMSFYPAHHITTGEGGAVFTDNPMIKRAAESIRDWGRDCWCKTGCDGTCGKRFDWKLGNLPHGYDHKYIYANVGYNLKATDMQAAIGCSQLKKLSNFIKIRKDNFEFYLKFFRKYNNFFILPKIYDGADMSPFGYLINIHSDAPFKRQELVRYLESKGIATRMLFGGNLTKQPAYMDKKYRVIGGLENTDSLMNNAFWIGVYPGINNEMREYVVEIFADFLENLDSN
ncbi:MAG: lipopolysaccharide biosynthesis protein RfbH [Candidatus Aenigmarchaeota archaeon]|nr:lipopolysaccharide biosynthesis protein RfbH [Candidatus Aenigmarchaeota archaeon]